MEPFGREIVRRLQYRYGLVFVDQLDPFNQ